METFSVCAQSCWGRGHWGPGREATHPEWPCSVATTLNRLHSPLPQTRMAFPPPGQGSAEQRLAGELLHVGLRSGKRILGEGRLKRLVTQRETRSRSWTWPEESLGSGALLGFIVTAPL